MRMPLFLSCTRLWARLGTADLTADNVEGSAEVEIVRFVEHPRYSHLQAYFDAAVAVLGSEITFGRFIRPICLPLRCEYCIHSHRSGS